MNILIVVPTLSSWEILPKLINSLKNQSNTNWKVLFIDGNSSKAHENYLKKICVHDKRFSFIKQKNDKGIFKAMNIGFKIAKKNEYLLFWGSDDMCIADNTINLLIKNIKILSKKSFSTDFIICKSCFYSPSSKNSKRPNFSEIKNIKQISSERYRLSLFTGFSQAHQATIFGPKIRKIIQNYSNSFELAADLDYYLRVSKEKNIFITFLPQDIVLVGEGGISSRKNLLRIFEVLKAYYFSFGIFFIVPFILRYLRRIPKV